MIIFFIRWWNSIKLKTRLIVFTVLSSSVAITSSIFWSLTVIQEDSLIVNDRLCKDLAGLFTSQILSNVNLRDDSELFKILEKIYLSTSNIRYITFSRIDGSLYFSLPIYYNSAYNFLDLHNNVHYDLLKYHMFNVPLVSNYNSLKTNITNITIPLIYNGQKIGTIALGVNTNLNYIASSHLIDKTVIFIFISIWFLALVVSFFNSLFIVDPVKELLLGIQNISLGNFKQRINYNWDSQFYDVIISFNEMAERLEFYEKTNIEKLILEKNKLECIVSTIADGAILVDLELRLLFVNYAAMKAFNWDNLDIIGKFIGTYLPSHVTQSLLPIFNNLVQKNCFNISNYPTEEICIHLDYGTHKIFRFILTAILDRNTSMLTSIAIIVQDISREVQLNDAKNQFIGNVSHELRTPLCNIGSFLETLLDYDTSLTLAQKKHFLFIANSETKRLGRLVNDILDLSRLESDFDYSLKNVNIIDILTSVVNTSHLIANKNQIDLILEIDDRVLFVIGHESLLFQVISNLVSNAIKFTHTYGQVVLRVYLLSSVAIKTSNNLVKNSDVNVIRIEIIDNGLGIDKLDHKVIFDRFVRIEDDVHTLQGTGLGLSIVKNILSKHKTIINIQSHLAVGTSFYFDLLQTL